MKKFFIILVLNIVLIGSSTPAQRAVATKYSPFFADRKEIIMVDWLPYSRGGQITCYGNYSKIEILSNSIYKGWDFFEYAMTHEFGHGDKCEYSEERAAIYSYDIMSYVNNLK
jgi:hypothetical protein